MAYTFESNYLDWPLVPGRAWDLFMPRQVKLPVAVFFVHGGGWNAGNRAGMHRIMSPLTDAGIVTASTDYRLQGVRITDQLTDVRETLGAFQARLRALGGPQRIVAYGESAGAHLALLLALAQPGACGEKPIRDTARTGPVHAPLAGVAVQSAPTTFEPWDDIFPQIWTVMQAIVGETYARHPDLYRAVSPLAHVQPGCPPVLLMEAANEHMFPIELNQRFVEAVRAVGSRAEMTMYPKAEHGFFCEIVRRCQADALRDLMRFVRSCGCEPVDKPM